MVNNKTQQETTIGLQEVDESWVNVNNNTLHKTTGPNAPVKRKNGCGNYFPKRKITTNESKE